MIDVNSILDNSYDLIYLNRPNLSSLYKQAYINAKTKICTDGAANKLLDELGEQSSQYLPDFIVGDMDSFTNSNSPSLSSVIKIYIGDQDSTDFQKSLDLTTSKKVVVLTDNGGRVDHIFASFNTLLLPQYHDKNIFLYGIGSFSFVIRKHAVIRAEGWKYCGIIPLMGRTKMNTEGFKWNLNGDFCEFGGLVSSSNQFTGDAVVDVDLPVIFTLSKN